MQDKYILPPDERPQLSDLSFPDANCVPIVDLKDLDGPNRAKVVQEIRRACEEHGIFQIVNHGVPTSVMKNMLDIAKEFFEMPVEDRSKFFSDDINKPVRLSTGFHPKMRSWRDYLAHSCHPLEEVINCWPEKPAGYREIAGNYAMDMRALILRLLAAISEALELPCDYLNTLFGKPDHTMFLNYYPACPNPDLTLGLQPHCDLRGITVLMQGDVSGLQVMKDETWVTVAPMPNAFVVNLGIQMEAVSNGRFKSAFHRALASGSKTRISIPTFYGPSNDVFLSPAASMVDEEHPAMYRGYKVAEFMEMFYTQEKSSRSALDYFKI